MADPISLMAVAGLVFAGRNLSTKSAPPKVDNVPPTMKNPEIVESNNFDASPEVPHKMEMENFGKRKNYSVIFRRLHKQAALYR